MLHAVKMWIIALTLLRENAEFTAFCTQEQGLGISVFSPLSYSTVNQTGTLGKPLGGLELDKELCA